MSCAAQDWSIQPTDVDAARVKFETIEPRDLFYRAATELLRLAAERQTRLSEAEALAVLLQTWNASYYQYRPFDAGHFAAIEELLTTHASALAKYRRAIIENLDLKEEQPCITELFTAFERVLGPVGAAKALHLLAPRFFPLWDRQIAEGYRLPLGPTGSNGDRYWDFMRIAQVQCTALKGQMTGCPNPLKSIDEFNYCKYNKGWLS